jgi:hypothetical protein
LVVGIWIFSFCCYPRFVKRRRIVLLLFGIAAIIFTAVLWPDEREPEYQGKKLSEWMAILYRDDNSELGSRERQKALDAIRHIGTNALPIALIWIQFEPSRLRFRIQDKLEKLPFRLGDRPPLNVVGTDKGFEKSHWAETVFAFLTTNAVSAVPELTRFISDRKAFYAAHAAAFALGQIGKEGLPALLATLSDTNSPTRAVAAQHISHIERTEAAQAVPVLIRYLDDPDLYVAEAVYTTLGHLHIEGGIAVPALIQAAHNPRSELRAGAVACLGRFGDHSRPAIPTLLQCLDDSNLSVAIAAAQALGTLRLEPDLVVPELAKCLENDDPSRLRSAMTALASFGSSARPAIPAILRILTDPEGPPLMMTATNALAQIAPECFEKVKADIERPDLEKNRPNDPSP